MKTFLRAFLRGSGATLGITVTAAAIAAVTAHVVEQAMRRGTDQLLDNLFGTDDPEDQE